jgi:hypothetical protein
MQVAMIANCGVFDKTYQMIHTGASLPAMSICGVTASVQKHNVFDTFVAALIRRDPAATKFIVGFTDECLVYKSSCLEHQVCTAADF